MSDTEDFIDVIEDLGLDDESLAGWDGQGGWEPVPPGEYVLAVKEAKKHTSKAGKPSINVTYEIISEGEYLGKELRHNYYSLDKESKGFARLVTLVRALGAPLVSGGGISITSLIGLQCIAEVQVDKSQYYDAKSQTTKEGVNNKVVNERTYEPPKAQKTPMKPAGQQTKKAVGSSAAK